MCQLVMKYHHLYALIMNENDELDVNLIIFLQLDLKTASRHHACAKILDFVGLDWDEVVMDHENHMDKVGLSGAERSTDQVFSFLFGTLHENQFFPF